MNSKTISIKSFSIMILGAVLLAGAGTLAAYAFTQQTAMPAAPGFADLRQPVTIADAPEAAQAWKQLLAAAGNADRAALRQYVAAGGPDAGPLADAFCDLLIQTAAAHAAAEERFGRLAAEHTAFFARNDAEAFTQPGRARSATVCAVLPVCGDSYEPTPVELQQIAGHWQVTVSASLRGTTTAEPTYITIGRLQSSAEVFRLAAAGIRAGTYSSIEDAVASIQGNLWHAGLRGEQPRYAAD